jgi:hypothetical protein
MKGLQGERLRQAFRHFDKSRTGYIEKKDFARIIYELARHKLSDSVLDNLEVLPAIDPGEGDRISYSECIAFHNVRFVPFFSFFASIRTNFSLYTGHSRNGPRRKGRPGSMRPLARRQDHRFRLYQPRLTHDALRDVLADGSCDHLPVRSAYGQERG